MPTSLELAQWAKKRVNINQDKGTEYKQLVKGLGAMIIQNGLLGTLLYLKAKSKPHHLAVMEDIFEFLKSKGVPNPQNLQFSEEKYLRLTSEVLEMNKWLRRYADILIESKDEGGRDDKRRRVQ
ncbi:MAG TPA: type III-B CRISPR module-associated protein Cmr5 [Thermotogota bacterium]|jgi:CRISPR-associated protein Cmr5|nr:type III-B CRISPR module-associated protein Cmr5 [Thermotogota bacterium]NLH18644.1 type III-B CRISPR module-associated protein Cmr5 [Thermotogaceae bacterium]OQC31107.1 MAG: CRISPR system Cmr subunit Cmr5 [Thermotogota bacterium ADurb.Bin062]HNW46472.1 type III-B CRISPR module-associated protein Cmr5 [Thermotogota bacterium]HOD91442.1 type III-B CRISPR module-associated protein Cmr5 [Thermotogota bacterium]